MTTITGTYQNHLIRHSNKIAIHTSSETICYREWADMVCKTANWIDAVTDANATLGIFLPNSIAFLQIFSGTAMAGRTAATFDAKWKPAELEQRLTVSSPSVLITTKESVGRIGNTDSCIILWEDALEQIRTCDSSWDIRNRWRYAILSRIHFRNNRVAQSVCPLSSFLDRKFHL